jgi:hypothetical protein
VTSTQQWADEVVGLAESSERDPISVGDAPHEDLRDNRHLAEIPELHRQVAAL